MHTGFYSWRDDLPCPFVRSLAVFCGLLAVSLLATWFYEKPATKSAARPALKSDWVEVERPFPASGKDAAARACTALGRNYGFFCQGGAEYVTRATLRRAMAENERR